MQPLPPPKKEEEERNYYLKFSIFLVATATFFFIIICLAGKPQIKHQTPSFVTCISILLNFTFLWSLKQFLINRWNFQKLEYNEIFKKNLVVGLTGISICGVIPQIVVVCVGNRIEIIYPCGIICNFTSTIFYALFLFNRLDAYIPIKECQEKYIIYGIHFGFSIIITLISPIFYSNQEELNTVRLVVDGYTAFFSPSSAELWIVLRVGIQLKPHQPRNTLPRFETPPRTARPAPPRVAQAKINSMKQVEITMQRPQPVPKPPTKLEIELDTLRDHPAHLQCEICMHNYSNMAIPRILIGCGHTVCEGCTHSLLKSKKVICPFCRKVTNVPDGMVEQLPKNYALLGLTQEGYHFSYQNQN